MGGGFQPGHRVRLGHRAATAASTRRCFDSVLSDAFSPEATSVVEQCLAVTRVCDFDQVRLFGDSAATQPRLPRSTMRRILGPWRCSGRRARPAPPSAFAQAGGAQTSAKQALPISSGTGLRTAGADARPQSFSGPAADRDHGDGATTALGECRIAVTDRVVQVADATPSALSVLTTTSRDIHPRDR